MKLVKVSDIFDISYGNSLTLYNSERDKKGVPFISRTKKNNGMSAKVKLIDNIKPNPKNTISVATGGSVMSSFLQKEPYYTGYHILILKPKIELTDIEMLFYCMCLKANKYKYNFGRQANKTLKDIQIPSYHDIPKWVYTTKIPKPIKKPLINKKYGLNIENWQYFKLGNIFNISKGKTAKAQTKGNIRLISATNSNNGSSKKINSLCNKNKANTITVSSNGSIAESFYQDKDFFTTGDINILECENINVYVALFINTIISKEKFRFNYGRKWGKEKMIEHEIKLPSKDNQPDWKFMENYIKSLNYSACLEAKGK